MSRAAFQTFREEGIELKIGQKMGHVLVLERLLPARLSTLV